MYWTGAHISASGGVDKIFERAAIIKADVCQIFTRNQRQWRAKELDEKVVENFSKLWKESDLESIFSHSSYLINLATDGEEQLEKSIETFKDEIKRCDILGLDYLVTHPGAHKGQGIDVGIEKYSKNLNDILVNMKPGVRVLLETTAGQGSCIGSRFEEIGKIISQLSKEAREHIGICLDTCHIFAAGYDISTKSGFEKVFEEFDDILGLENLRVFHLNDSKKECGSKKDRHEHIGKGEIGEVPFKIIMNSREFDKIPKVIETETGVDMSGDKMNLEYLRGLREVS